MLKLFIAYSHRDQELRQEIENHLSMLKREAIIETWYDRQIEAGEEIDARIDAALESANVVLLLVSSNFLASDYCFEVEMQRAMAKHHAGTARVIPIILRPCDWQSAPFGKLNALPEDGRPVTKFSDHHEALAQVAAGIRRVAAALQPADVASREQAASAGGSRGEPASEQSGRPRSGVKLRKRITDKDRDDFLEASFEVIAGFFADGLAGLEEEHDEVETRFKRSDAYTFAATVYVRGDAAARCKIRYSVDRGFAHGVTYSSDPSSENSFNELLSVEESEGALSLKAMGMAMLGSGRDPSRPMAQQEAAEYYWQVFVDGLQR